MRVQRRRPHHYQTTSHNKAPWEIFTKSTYPVNEHYEVQNLISMAMATSMHRSTRYVLKPRAHQNTLRKDRPRGYVILDRQVRLLHFAVCSLGLVAPRGHLFLEAAGTPGPTTRLVTLYGQLITLSTGFQGQSKFHKPPSSFVLLLTA